MRAGVGYSVSESYLGSIGVFSSWSGDVKKGPITIRDINTNNDYRIVVHGLVSGAAILSFPVTTTVCARATVVFMQRRRGLSLRQTLFLANRGWASSSLIKDTLLEGRRSSLVVVSLFVTLFGWRRLAPARDFHQREVNPCRHARHSAHHSCLGRGHHWVIANECFCHCR